MTQHYCCVVIPAFDHEGYLPPGEHHADWPTFVARFGGHPRRDWLLTGLRRALLVLQQAGCLTAFIDGSFVTAKLEPDDYDGVWDATGVRSALLDPVLLNFDDGRLLQKVKYFGELFPAQMPEGISGKAFLEFFQQRADNGAAKGIIRIHLGTLT